MKVKDLIKKLSKLDQNARIGTFSSEKYDFDYTPIAEIITQKSVELHPDFRGKGKKVLEDWIILVGANQIWRHISDE